MSWKIILEKLNIVTPASTAAPIYVTISYRNGAGGPDGELAPVLLNADGTFDGGPITLDGIPDDWASVLVSAVLSCGLPEILQTFFKPIEP